MGLSALRRYHRLRQLSREQAAENQAEQATQAQADTEQAVEQSANSAAKRNPDKRKR